MRTVKLFLSAIMSLSALTASSEAIVPSHKPNNCQKKMTDRGYGMFVHFGMNTFIDMEWSEGKEPATIPCR